MEDPGRVVFFGDSIARRVAEKYGMELIARYPDKDIKVRNEGVKSETSRDGLKRLEKIVARKPNVVVIGFGMNDWRKGVGKDEFKKNINTMVDGFQKTGCRVILTTINPAYLGMGKGVSPEPDEYSEVIRGIARERRIKVADINSVWKKRFKPVQKGLEGDIHPNGKGYDLCCEVMSYVVPQSHTLVLWQYNGRECRCNYRCPYCYYAYSEKSENYFWGDIEDWRKAFKGAFQDGDIVFYLAFGEPTLGEAFYEVLSMIESEPRWSLRITTNLSGDLKRLVKTKLAREGRLNINASFHPTQTSKETFRKKLLFLRRHGIECPIVYVMWPPQMDRFEEDFRYFDENDFVLHIRRFTGDYKKKHYPDSYTDKERRFIAKYCDDATIKYMLNNKPVLDRRTFSGLHFYVVDCTGNVGMDSDSFWLHTKFRTLYGNIIQSHQLCLPLEPPEFPVRGEEGTVDGVSNYLETGYTQLEGNNVLDFARQGGVYKDEKGVHYKHLKTDFTNSRIRADYYFPPRSFIDRLRLMRKLGFVNYIRGYHPAGSRYLKNLLNMLTKLVRR